VEGKLFLSQSPTPKTLTVIVPGLLGSFASQAEERYINSLLTLGDVFVMRHNGLNIRATETNDAIYCPEKSNSPFKYTGKQEGEYSASDMIKEPAVVMRALSGNYDSVKIISHSFGGLQVAGMLNIGLLNTDEINKITRWVSLAGWTGKDATDGLKVDYDTFFVKQLAGLREAGIFNIVEANSFAEELHQIFQQIESVPNNISVVAASTHEHDAVLNDTPGRNLQQMSEHALLVLDETEGVEQAGGVSAHDMAHMSEKALMKMLLMRVHNKHTVTTKNPD